MLRLTNCVRWLILACLAGFAPGIDAGEPPAAGQVWPSKKGHFQVSFESRLQPLTINRIHSWVLHVETGAGAPVEDAEITVDGGMPAHDHGLPTRPRVTRNLGGGDYLVEGMRFHMNGQWEITVAISTAGNDDMVVIPLEL